MKEFAVFWGCTIPARFPFIEKATRVMFDDLGARVHELEGHTCCPEGTLVKANDPDAFFKRGHDVIVEVLGGVDPARTLVARALAQDIPVVTANKSLVAVAGPSLQTLARRHHVPFRFEASVVAGVPFLHALIDRPFAGAITGIEGLRPTLAAIPDATLLAGAPLNIPLSGADADNDILYFSVASSNPQVSVQTLDPFENRTLRVSVQYSGDPSTTADNFSGDMTFQLFENWAPHT